MVAVDPQQLDVPEFMQCSELLAVVISTSATFTCRVVQQAFDNRCSLV